MSGTRRSSLTGAVGAANANNVISATVYANVTTRIKK